MSEIGEIYSVMKQRSREKRAANREQSPAILVRNGIRFVSKNDGAHLVVEHAGITVDFWPGTGNWIGRGCGRGRGVQHLVNWLKKTEKQMDSMGEKP